MKRFTNGLALGVALSLLGAESLQAQSSENEQLKEATDITVLPSPSMADFLRSEATKTHCCTSENFLEGAELYKRAAEHGFDGNPDNLETGIDDRSHSCRCEVTVFQLVRHPLKRTRLI